MARTLSSSFRFGAVGSGDRKRVLLPMAEMNTTPLIDVFLVLLIMFIIIVPSQTHQVSVSLLRRAQWRIDLRFLPATNNIATAFRASE